PWARFSRAPSRTSSVWERPSISWQRSPCSRALSSPAPCESRGRSPSQWRPDMLARRRQVDKLSPETRAAQALGEIDPATGAVSPPIHPSTIYERDADGSYRSNLAYTRADNPTYDHAEHLLTALEGGAECMLFASGSTAATAVFQSLLPGDHVLV